MRLTKEQKQARVDKERFLISTLIDDKKKLKDELFKLHYNLPEIVVNSCGKELKYHDDYEDFLQAGFFGMCRAFDKYDWSGKWLFFTYAEFWVRKYVYEELQKLNLIKAPKNMISCFMVDDFESLPQEYLVYEENKDPESVEFKNDEIAEFVTKNELEIRIFSTYFIDHISMSTIAENERITVTKVKEVLRGKRNNKGILVIKPFFEIFKEEMDKYDCKSFSEFSNKYIKID